MSLDPVDYTRKEGKESKVFYAPNGYIPYGPIDWRAIATLRGIKKKAGDWYMPELTPANGKLATPAEVETYIRGIMTGSKPEVVGMSHVKNWSDLFRVSPITARVGDVLAAIVAGNKDFFTTLLMPTEPPKEVSPPSAKKKH
jgi:hypothetical protein